MPSPSPSSDFAASSSSTSEPASGTWRETTGPDAWWALVIGRTFHGPLSAVEQVLASLSLEPARASSSTPRGGRGERQAPAPAAGGWALVGPDFSPAPPPSQAESGAVRAERRRTFLHTTLIPHLLRHFSSSAAYSLFPDTLPALALLRGAGGSSSVPVGVASNSDDRILLAMRALGLGEYLNLELGPACGAEGSCQAEKHDGQGRGPPPTLSYDVGAEKPSRAFFERALARANRHLLLARDRDRDHGGEPTGETGSGSGIHAHTQGQAQGHGQREIAPAEVLFVGDHLLEDFRGAREAGMQALWLRRSAHAHARPQAQAQADAQDAKAQAHDGPSAQRATAQGPGALGRERQKESEEEAAADDDGNSHVGPHNEEAERVLRAHGLSEEEQRHTVRSLMGVVEWLRSREGR